MFSYIYVNRGSSEYRTRQYSDNFYNKHTNLQIGDALSNITTKLSRGQLASGLAVGWSAGLSCSPILAGEVVTQRFVDGFRVRKRIRQVRVDNDYVTTFLESFCVLSADDQIL